MPKNLTKKAADMLLNGATLLSEPCPYCSGVRVMKDGYALCCGCGREPEKKEIKQNTNQNEKEIEKQSKLILILEKKIESLSKELEGETDHEKQQSILKSINSALETLEKAQN